MRILSLNLQAFGPFTDTVLDLSEGQEGLHLIYGDNEAGKSSALRALADAFYGIPLRTKDNFLHDNPKLRIAVQVRHSDGTELEFVRRKANKNSLLDAQGEALPDHALHPFLAGVDRQVFTTLYGIDHGELRRGGRGILEAKGDVGGSLFDAGMGGASLREVLAALDEEAGRLFRTRGKQVIDGLIVELKEARQNSKSLALSSREWEEHDQALNDARQEKGRLVVALGNLTNNKSRFERVQAALPKVARLKVLLVELGPIDGAPLLRPDFAEERRGLVGGLNQARTSLASIQESLKGIRETIEGLNVREELLGQDEAITELHQRLGGHRKAAEDRRVLVVEREQSLAQARAILRDLRPELSLEDAEPLRLTEARRAQIRDLGNRCEALAAEVLRYREAVGEIDAALAEKQAQLEELAEPRDSTDLDRVVKGIRRAGPVEENLREVQADLRQQEDQCQVDLKKLRLWSGALAELEALPIPSAETVGRFDSLFVDNATELTDAHKRIAEACQEVERLESQLAELQRSGGVPTEADLRRARQRRDEGWRLVRRAWLQDHRDADAESAFDADHDLPDAYERSVAEADDVADRIRRDADQVARYESLSSRRDELGEQVDRLQRAQERLEKGRAAVEEEWDREWDPLGATPLPPKEMRAWIAKHGELVRQAEGLRASRHTAERLEREIGEYRSKLDESLRHLGEPAAGADEALEALLDRAATVAARIGGAAVEREQLGRSITELRSSRDQAMRRRQEAEDARREWQDEWIPAMEELGLTAPATPAQANAHLDRIQELFDALREAEDRGHRIEAIEHDADQFEQDVEGLVAQVAPDLCDLPFDQAAAKLNGALAAAREDKAALGRLRAQEEEKEEDIERTENAILNLESRIAELCKEASCAESEFEEIEKRSTRKRQLVEERARIEEQLIELGNGLSVEQVIEEVEAVDAEQLPAQLIEADEAVRDLDRRRSALDRTIGSEEAELARMDGGSKAAEAEETAQSLLASIRDHAERFVRLRLAAAVLRQEIERYREENQDPVLQRSSTLFAQLTLNSFSGLQPEFEGGDEPVLVGTRPTDEKVLVEDMSDGTLDQLYLSLRLASLERSLEANEPMPFIVDDILINFDDSRAEAALKVLAGLSQNTQIICFTHHRRLVELAERALDKDVLQLHTLGRASGAP